MRGKPKFSAGVATPLESLRIGPRPLSLVSTY